MAIWGQLNTSMKSFNFKTRFYILFLFALLVGCSSVVEIENGTYETRRALWDNSRDDTNYQRRTNQENADEKCLSQGKIVDFLGEWNLRNHELVLRFKCIDPSVKRQRDLEAFEANKREEREKKLAEEWRKRNEADRLRFEAEQKSKETERLRQEALKAAEWERTRPQREAAKRKALAEEEARLNSICPTYYVIRQSCAAAVWYGDCMKYRYGKNYSKSDDNTCFNR